MDDSDDIFNFKKPFERITVKSGTLKAGQFIDKTVSQKILKREKMSTDYAQVYVDAEKHQILQDIMGGPSTSGAAGQSYLNQIEEFEDNDDDEGAFKPKIGKLDGEKFNYVYDKYRFEQNYNSDLPIFDKKTEILHAIRNNRAIVLQGDTGCGKTTQVPQYILDDACERKEYCNIICTQPRRIAAISIAKRVCQEKQWELGSVVGYQVGLHENSSEDTRLLYCTTGVLLQKLVKSKDMSCYTHVILDEVHERDQDMDFLLIVVRRLLITNSPNTKVILMSATIDEQIFSKYFEIGHKGQIPSPAPILKVDTRRLYSVQEFFLDELDRLGDNNHINYDEPGILEEMYMLAYKLIIICEKIDLQSQDVMEPGKKPAILIFLPGINEIDKMDKQISIYKEQSSQTNIKLYPIRLHSMITTEEQAKVFQKTPPNHRKIILATNIAESSITVPDVKYVIDFCLVKSLVTDSSTGLTSLKLHWASRSNCRQRAGRAGRVMNGRVYRLVSKHFYDNIMEEYASPEMLRCPLENVVLKAKLLDMGPPQAVLALALSPPDLSDIRNTILVLKEAGALYRFNKNGIFDYFDGELTFVGRVMSALPIDIRVTRLIMFGYIFSLLDDSIVIAAGLNVKSIFEFPYNKGLQAYTQKLSWSNGSGSDLSTILFAYKVWLSRTEQNTFNDEDSEKNWARRYFINTRSMKEMHLLIQEIKARLHQFGIKETHGSNRVNWLEKEKAIVMKIVIAGAFYPNYFFKPPLTEDSGRSLYHVLEGRDPCNTLFFSNFDKAHIGQLYVQSVKNLFEDAEIAAKDIEVRFQTDSQKILVTFVSDTVQYGNSNKMTLKMPGRVRPEIYKAIKMRYLRWTTRLRLMDLKEEVAYAESKGIGAMKDGKWIPKKKKIVNPELTVIPTMGTRIMRGNITHIETCGKFWFQPLSEEIKMNEIIDALNGPNSDITSFNHPSEISMGMMLAAPFSEGMGRDIYHRAQVRSLNDRNMFKVFFVDHGNNSNFSYRNLRKFGPITSPLTEMPPRIFECYLAEVRPSSVYSPNGKWCDEAMELLQEHADRNIIEIEVYSVVHGVAAVFVKTQNGTINEILIEKGYAQHLEENYMSKNDHDNRIRKQNYADLCDEEDLYNSEDYLRSLQGEEHVSCLPPPREKLRSRCDLKGPYTPLETRIHAATRAGSWKTISVEQDSVNSVLLDSDPQDRHERLLVAAAMTENTAMSKITARATTWMPNIPGFGPLMGLMFCPTMEIRRDKYKTKYVSVLTGLGCDENKKPYFEEHDIVFNLDVEISPKDIETINQIRYSMDSLLYAAPGEEHLQVTGRGRTDITFKIKNLIISLLERRRKYIEINYDVREHQWGRMLEDTDESDFLECVNIYEHRSIFPFHTTLRLQSPKLEQIQTLREHCKELHEMSGMSHSIKEITCKLCAQTLEGIPQLRIHLLCQLHRDREYQIGFTEK